MRRSTDSLGAAPLSLLIASVIVAIITIPKKKTSSPYVKEKRKAGTRAGLTKAAIAAAAAAKLIEGVGANGFSLRGLAKALGSARLRSISISKAALEPSLARSPSRRWPASPGH